MNFYELNESNYLMEYQEIIKKKFGRRYRTGGWRESAATKIVNKQVVGYGTTSKKLKAKRKMEQIFGVGGKDEDN